MNPDDHIRAGLRREDALRIYTESVNKPDTLFSYNPSLPAKLDLMRELLHDPITMDEAYALNDVIYRRRRFTDMIAWLQDDPVSWDGYFGREEFRAEEADRQLLEDVRREQKDWAKGIRPPKLDLGLGFSPEKSAELEERSLADAKAHYLPKARPCPTCGTPAEFLEWFRYSSPPSVSATYYDGWKTRCWFCLQEVDLFIGMMGTKKRRLLRPAALLRKNNVPM